jgi:hypothetical protein
LSSLKLEQTEGRHIAAGIAVADTEAAAVDTEADEIAVVVLQDRNVDHNLRNNFLRPCRAHNYCTAPCCPLDNCLYINLPQPELTERQDSQMLDAEVAKQQGGTAIFLWKPTSIDPRRPKELGTQGRVEPSVAAERPQSVHH